VLAEQARYAMVRGFAVKYEIDGVSFEVRREFDFSVLSRYGKVFCVFDGNDSGNISFGVEGERGRLFVKIAYAGTPNGKVPKSEVVASLRKAMPLYGALRHNSLIELVEHYPNGDAYVTVFKWACGECLLDYWNYDRYIQTGEKSPQMRFRELPLETQLRSFAVVCDFLQHVAAQGYVAIDFYDGSIMYDFATDTTTICDIDFYEKTLHTVGDGPYWGSSRFMAPEESTRGSILDEVTNVYTLGATAFVYFGGVMNGLHSDGNRERENWQLSDERYAVAMKAVAEEKADRYRNIAEFISAWKNADKTGGSNG